MKFRPIRRFIGGSVAEIVHWLEMHFNSAMRELYIGLGGLSFKDNFDSFEWTGTLLPLEEKQISHSLQSIPSGYLIFKQVGDAVVDAGVSPWTTKVVYLRNNHASNPVELKAIFFR